jgi:signal transduction histidine kinase
MRNPGDVRAGVARWESLAGWGAAAVAVFVIYVTVVVGGGLLLGRSDEPDLALSVLATALVASVLEPVRSRAETLTARWLKRAQGTAYDRLADFPRQLARPDSGEQAPAVIARMLAVGTGVEWAQVWVLVDERLRLVATYPAGAAADEPEPMLYDNAPRDGVRSVTVAHASRPLGVLRVGESRARRMTPVEERLLGGLAAQAGMVLETAQLRAEISQRLEELTLRERQLRRARGELVSVQDRERRQLERDIHDGAQQQLVALAINLKLARALLESDPDQARLVLDEQAAATADAIRTLSDLSSGLLPESLGQQGLAAAVRAATANNPVPVQVHAPTLSRHPPAVEATLYFCVLEAVQNATKHAEAGRIDVRIVEEPDRITVDVHDDGRGMEAGEGTGSGLANLRERVAALGGELNLEGTSGDGTVVRVWVPSATLAGTEVTR